ncbi:MAG TPA: carbohydrate-binding protein [Cytophagales bacterium]|nr:carbohydrate-binding protein [Cytophagales bacterium]
MNLLYKKGKAMLFVLLLTMLSFPFTKVYGQDPPQYGTPFAGVPDPRDVNMYQVHVRPYSASGNLAGVIARLDAIKALGTNVIYLMPIYPHGTDSRSSASPYCVKDHKAVASEYGSLNDLRQLVSGAHDRGMAVLMDFIPNQTSWDHPWITQHPDWYERDGSGNIIALFPDVAKLNFNNSAMRSELINIMRYWIFAANIDGYRVDYANNPPLDFWTSAISNLRGITSHNLLMFAEGDRLENFQVGFDLNFGDKWYYDAIKKINDDGISVSQIQATTNTEYTYANSSQQVVRYTANHDTESSTTPIQVFDGHNGVVANFLVSAYMRGVPMMTSGQEVDFNQVIPWPWNTVKINWNQNTGAAADFTKILNFRTASTAIRRGSMANYSNNDVCAFTKISGAEKVVVITNLRNGSRSFVIPSALAGTYQDAYTGANVTLNSGATQTLNAFQYIVLTNTGGGCTPTAITPYLSVNSGAWQQTSTASLTEGGTITMGPQPSSGGSWSWTGPGGFSATTREITRSNIQANQSGNYIATHTNSSGCTSTQTFTITVTAGPSLTVSPSSLAISSGGTNQTVSISSNVSWSVTDNRSWITVTPTSGSNNANITVSATSNTGGARSGTVTVTGGGITRTINVSQSAVGSAAVIPGTIEAESWANMSGVQTETTTDAGGGLNVGWIDTGDWMDYNVNVSTAGSYTVAFRMASGGSGGTIQLRNSGGTTLCSATIGGTGGWQNWTTVNATATLPAGTQTLRLYATSSGFNVNWIQFTANGTGTTYYAIKNRWKNTYLYDAGANVGYGTSVANNNYKWQKVAVDANYFWLKNLGTGEYMHIENQTGAVQATAVDQSWWSAQWSQDNIDDTWVRFRNRWQTGSIIHVENQTGAAQYANAQEGWYSAQWQLVSVSGARLGIDESAPEFGNTSIEIFPNPVNTGFVSIKIPEKAQSFKVKLFDSQGNLVKQANVSKNELEMDLGLDKKGIYFIVIEGDKKSYSRKLIIE